MTRTNTDTCIAIHQKVDAEISRLTADIERLDDDLAKFNAVADKFTKLMFVGGNGETVSLLEQVHKNTEFRVEIQSALKKLTYQMWGIVIGIFVIVFRNAIIDLIH